MSVGRGLCRRTAGGGGRNWILEGALVDLGASIS